MRKTVLILYVVIAISAFASVEQEDIFLLNANLPSLTGLLWMGLTGLVSISVLVQLKKVRVLGYDWPFLIFSFWVIARYLLTPTGLVGLKDVLWYSMPALFGLFVPIAVRRNYDAVAYIAKRLEKLFLFSAWIGVGFFAMVLLLGFAEMTYRGPRGDLIEAGRSIPLYLLVVLSISLANARFGPEKRRGRVVSLVSLGTIFFSLGRMASFIALTSMILSKTQPRRKWQLIGVAFLVVGIILLAVTQVPLLQQRFFQGDWEIAQGLEGIRVAGRDVLWGITFDSAMDEPIFGQGLGTARKMIAQGAIGTRKGVTEYQPHNEYLQIFHDTGLVGLFLVVFAWGWVFVKQWRLWENGRTLLVKKWGMAGVLATMVVLIYSVTGTVLHTPFVIAPVSIIIGIANQLGLEDRIRYERKQV